MQSAHFAVGCLYQIVPHPTTSPVGDVKAKFMNPPDDHAGYPTSTSSSDEVKSFRRFQAANPDLNPHYPCFYVGQTHLTPEERFAKHKSGHKAGKYVFRYGLHLVPAMYDHINPVESRERAEEIETHLTNYLRRHGYGVWSN